MKKYIARLLIATAFFLPGISLAQSDSGGPAVADAESEDIVVTARRTNESLQDVPVAISAFSGEALTARGVDTLDQVANYTPNIRFDGAAALSGGNYNATVFIRGVGQNDFAIFSEPGVGFYVDDVFYARSIGGVLDAVDIESVQVLRGPQGTLFGKNTIGGAVLINTAKPDLDDVTGTLEATTGRFNRLDVKGAINIPLITDRLALRVSAATINRDGYVKRLVDGGTQGDRNADSFRAKLRWQPNAQLTIDLSADYTRARETSAPSDLLAVANVPGITGQPFLARYNALVAPTLGIVAPNGARALNASFITASPFETFATGPNRNDLDLWGVQNVISYDIGGATLKSISAYRDLEAFFTRDGDNTPFTFRQTTNDDKQWQFSQELQLSGKAIDERLNYVVGAYYFKEKASDIASADLAIGLSPPLVTTPPFTPAVFPSNFTNNRGYALYGQAGYKLTDGVTLTLGGRYSRDKKRFTSINVRQRDNVEFINVTRNGTFSKFTPYVGVSYEPSKAVLLYASYSKGYKQGGFNGRPLADASEVNQFAPEELDTYEVGLKSQWLDNRLTANIALFHSIYRDIQLTVNATPLNFTDNAAKGKIDGLELEFVARPARWFAANASLGYTNSRYTNIVLTPGRSLPITLASKFVKAPDYSVSFGSEVSHEFGSGGTLKLRGDINLYSKIFQDVANTPLITENGYYVVNGRLTYTLPGEKLQFAVFGSNLTNSLYLVSGNVSSAFGLAEASYGRPREWGISATFRF